MALYFVITFDDSNKLLSLLKFTEEEQAASTTIEDIRIVGLIFIAKNTRQKTINFIFYTGNFLNSVTNLSGSFGVKIIFLLWIVVTNTALVFLVAYQVMVPSFALLNFPQ